MHFSNGVKPKHQDTKIQTSQISVVPGMMGLHCVQCCTHIFLIVFHLIRSLQMRRGEIFLLLFLQLNLLESALLWYVLKLQYILIIISLFLFMTYFNVLKLFQNTLKIEINCVCTTITETNITFSGFICQYRKYGHNLKRSNRSKLAQVYVNHFLKIIVQTDMRNSLYKIIKVFEQIENNTLYTSIIRILFGCLHLLTNCYFLLFLAWRITLDCKLFIKNDQSPVDFQIFDLLRLYPLFLFTFWLLIHEPASLGSLATSIFSLDPQGLDLSNI